MNKNEEKLEKNSSVNRIQEDVKKKEKLSLPFLICYILNLGMLIITIISDIDFVTFDGNGKSVFNNVVASMALGYFAIMFFATSILMMILTVILGILNKNRITNQTLKKKINKMLWALGIGHAIVIFLFVWMF